jgi:Lon protease-like protein
MFPLSMVVFPHQTVGLCVFEDRYKQLLNDTAASQVFGTCLIARGSEVGGGDERTSVGTVVRILASQPLANGQVLLMAQGEYCVRIAAWEVDDPYPRARIEQRCCDDVMIDPDLLDLAQTSVRAVRALQSEVEPDIVVDATFTMAEDPWERAWQLCSMTPMATLDQFKVLSLSDPNERLRLLVEICCERYGDFQRMLALQDPSMHPLTSDDSSDEA